MLVAEFLKFLAGITGRDVKEMELYARRLREAALFPTRTDIRKLPVSTSGAAHLILAVMGADHAAMAAEVVMQYSDLSPAQPVLKKKSLIDLLHSSVADAHSDHELQKLLNNGTLSVLRYAPFAIFRQFQPAREIVFRAKSAPLAMPPESPTEQHMSGTTLVRLSYAIAGVQQPTIAPYLRRKS